MQRSQLLCHPSEAATSGDFSKSMLRVLSLCSLAGGSTLGDSDHMFATMLDRAGRWGRAQLIAVAGGASCLRVSLRTTPWTSPMTWTLPSSPE